MESILQNRHECWLTRLLYNEECTQWLERHEPFGGNGRRELCLKYGLTVYLNHFMHNESPAGVHHCEKHRLMLQRYAQREAMAHYNWTEKDFIALFGKNYLDERALDIWPEEEM